MSQLNNALYQTYLQPWIRMMSSPQLARSVLELNPLRLSYSLFSDKKPMMRAVAPLVERAQTNRTRIAAENPFTEMQQNFSQTMIDLLNLYRDARDQLVEQTFHAVYGSLMVQAACGISHSDGPPRPRPGRLPSIQAAFDVEVRRLKGIAEGSSLDAAARVLSTSGRPGIASRSTPSRPCASYCSRTPRSRRPNLRLRYASSGQFWRSMSVRQLKRYRDCCQWTSQRAEPFSMQ